MCTVVFLRRPGHAWPLIIAANRDEMADRPWRPPARHWGDRPDVVAGMDELSGGSWLGMNDNGVVAGVLNRPHSLGPMSGKRTRGELVLEMLDHADASEAADAIADLDGSGYRGFNLFVADNQDAYWVRSTGDGLVEVAEIPPGVSMLTAHDLNDTNGPRTARHLPRFRAAPAPEPTSPDGWFAWTALLASRDHGGGVERGAAMLVGSESGFGTVSSSLIALPAIESNAPEPVWLFNGSPRDKAGFAPVNLA
jgi:hypothetical protein